MPIVQETRWAPGPVWTGAENLARSGIRSPDRSAQSLYRLSYPSRLFMAKGHQKFGEPCHKTSSTTVYPWRPSAINGSQSSTNLPPQYPSTGVYISSVRSFLRALHYGSFFVSAMPNATSVLKLLKPTGYVMHQQFNIQQLYVLPTLYLCVLYLSENKQRLVPLIS